MKRNKESTMRIHEIDIKFCLILTGLLLVFLVSCIYRRPREGEGFYNSDATYHVLLTMEAYEESDFSVHSFLPIQTFRAENNKFINNGPSLVQDDSGNSFYVSFSPPGFYAPYLFCKLFRLPLSIHSIYIFNCFLMLISAALCAVLVCIALKKKVLSVLAFLAYIFIPEVLMTQGIVYWHHSLSQVFLLSQLVIFSVISFERPKNKRLWQILFLAVSFLYPYIEWTGFVSNIGFALCVFINGFSLERTDRGHRRLLYNHAATSKMVILGAATIAALGYYLWRFSKIAAISKIITSLSASALGRSSASYLELFKGYFVSYKPLLVLTAVFMALALIVTSSRKKLGELLARKRILTLLFAAFFPLLENAAMTEHAIEYTFDRLKFAPFLILIMCVAVNALSVTDKKEVLASVLCGGVVLSSLSGLKTYNDGKVVNLGDGYRNSFVLRDYLDQNYLDDDNAILVKRGWRAWGFLQTMYHRNIFCTALYSDSALITEATKRDCQYIVYLTEGAAYWDVGVYNDADIFDIRNGTVVELSSETGNIVASEK